MIERIFGPRLLLGLPAFRASTLLRPTRHLQPLTRPRCSSSIPNITQPSFWVSLIPRPLRWTSSPSNKVKKPKSTEWNPATFFIVIFLLIGSMSIQMIALRNDFAAFSRRANAKISLLREIIQRVQKGEVVDVEGLLGTGDPEKEKNWEEVLQEIEEEEKLWEDRRKKPRRLREPGTESVPTTGDVTSSSTTNNTTEQEITKPKKKSNAPPGFY